MARTLYVLPPEVSSTAPLVNVPMTVSALALMSESDATEPNAALGDVDGAMSSMPETIGFSTLPLRNARFRVPSTTLTLNVLTSAALPPPAPAMSKLLRIVAPSAFTENLRLPAEV